MIPTIQPNEAPPEARTRPVLARPISTTRPVSLEGGEWRGAPVDRCAIASTVCGLTAFVPIVSQLASIVLGVLALRRIRRRRLQGVAVRGRGLAAFGIGSGVVILVGWIGMALALLAVREKLTDSTGSLQRILQATRGTR